ncbi:MAG TPA: TetR/AcrR family transcriptional regulator [Armatimonadota bacterium]|jgi:AcrR family transcriptional regulator
MPRLKSHDKRNKILSAAIRVFAEHGLAAPTSAISQTAGVAEGTLFTYFETKDDLLNALYREIKLELAGVMMSDFARKKDVRSKLRHIWDAYVNWGVAQPDRRRLLAYLKVSDKLTEETKAVGYAPFAEIQVMAREAIAQKLLRDLPLEFITAAMEALAQTTMELMAAHPSKAGKYRAFGFEMLWNGITRS